MHQAGEIRNRRDAIHALITEDMEAKGYPMHTIKVDGRKGAFKGRAKARNYRGQREGQRGSTPSMLLQPSLRSTLLALVAMRLQRIRSRMSLH